MELCQLQSKLRRADLRQTRQRIALASLLFGSGNRHVTAERSPPQDRETRVLALLLVYVLETCTHRMSKLLT